MKTMNIEKIEKARELLALIKQRLHMKLREDELKKYFKASVPLGQPLEAGEVVILIERRSRTDLDREKLERKLGVESMGLYETKIEFDQVNVKERGAK